MGNGEWGMGITAQSRFPIPDSRFPVPDSRFPIPDSRFPISDVRPHLVPVSVDELLDVLGRAGSAEAGVLDRTAKADVVAEVISSLGILQKIVDVLATDLVMTGLISAVMRFVSLRHAWA